MPAPTIQLPLTGQETDALLQLLDHAVKAGGLAIAANAVFFHQRIAQLQRQAVSAIEGPAGNVGQPGAPGTQDAPPPPPRKPTKPSVPANISAAQLGLG